MIDRHLRILDILSQLHRVEVSVLSDILSVSQVTIRKDLDFLDERGLIVREHGYACLNNSDNAGKRIAYHYDIKKRIAKAAVATVDNGNMVMIESGSCCAILAEELITSKKDITIITNSIFIANFVRHLQYTKIIILGGLYQSDSQIVIGQLTKKCAESFISDKFFIGASGFSSRFGFTGKDYIRVQTIQDLTECAKEVFVLTESEKFMHQGALSLVRMENITGVFTDDGIPADAENSLMNFNIKINKVPQHV
jgi:DeoR/GlpR family transcriptional regulator of sugar metabolism